MAASEPENVNEQENRRGVVSIHIHAPDNRIAARDYIEVNIHLSDHGDQKRGPQDDFSTLPLSQPSELRQLLARTAELLVALGDHQRSQPTLTRK